MKRKTKKTGKSPWTASPEPVRIAAKRPSAPKASYDEGVEDEQYQHAERSRGEAHAGREADDDVDRGLEEAERDGASELSEEQRDAPHRRQRDPVQEPGLDVSSEVGAGVHRREKRALYERDGKQESDHRAARESRKMRLRAEAAGVDRQQKQREDHRPDHVRRLAHRANDRAPRRAGRPGPRARPQAAGSIASSPGALSSSSSSPSPPSSERPVFARNTSSSDGWWSWSDAIARPSASAARTMPARSA